MSTQNSNLDISRIDSENLDELAKRIEDFYKADSSVKASLTYNWERNHMMLDGKQWIVYDGDKGRGGAWKTLTVSKANEYIPRPVTNYLFDIYQTLKSYLIQNKPCSTVVPNTMSYRDKQAAKLANLCAEANWERLKEEKNYEYAASCMTLYGTVFKKDYWDTSTIQMAKVPKMEQQPMQDPSTGAIVGYEEKEVIDPETGDVLYDEIPLGDINTVVVEPYRIAIDPLASDLHTARWIMEYSIQPLDWLVETYSREEEGFTGLAETLKAEKTLSGDMQRFYALKNSSGVKNSGGINSTGGSDEMVENAAVLKEYYERPSRKYPRGRLVAVANNVTLYSGPSPYSGPELGDWHPYSECRWEVVPGRFWGKSPLDPVVEIQKQVNSIDAAIILVRKTMAIPQKLIPRTSGIKPGEWTGRPGQEVRFTEGGTPPSTIPASGVDAQVFQERAQKLEDMKQISGAIDILKGDRPAGVTAASALEMLFEVGTGKLRPGLDRWKTFVEGSQKKQLRLIATKYKEPRPQFIAMLAAKNKEIPEEAINNFIGTDLHDNCNVRIEAGSNIPKLQSAEKSQLLQLAQIGTLNLQDPKNQMEFNQRMGIIGFDNTTAPDVKRAEWENDRLEGGLPCVVFVDDDHQTHIDVLLRRKKEPSYMDLTPEVQAAFEEHQAEREQYKQKALMQQQMEAAATGQPITPAPPPQVATVSQGPGVSEAVSKAVTSPDVPKIGQG